MTQVLIDRELLERIRDYGDAEIAVFRDDNNGPGEWMCPACEGYSNGTWRNGKLRPFPGIAHADDCWLEQIRAVLANPAQQGEALEVVGWVDDIGTFIVNKNGKPAVCNEPFVDDDLVRLSDAHRAIAELTDRNTKLCATINRMVAEGVLICDERDTLRQQLTSLGESYLQQLDAVSARNYELRKQRDKLAELLREARLKMAYMLKHGEWYSPEELIERIDTALSELTP